MNDKKELTRVYPKVQALQFPVMLGATKALRNVIQPFQGAFKVCVQCTIHLLRIVCQGSGLRVSLRA